MNYAQENIKPKLLKLIILQDIRDVILEQIFDGLLRNALCNAASIKDFNKRNKAVSIYWKVLYRDKRSTDDFITYMKIFRFEFVKYHISKYTVLSVEVTHCLVKTKTSNDS